MGIHHVRYLREMVKPVLPVGGGRKMAVLGWCGGKVIPGLKKII